MLNSLPLSSSYIIQNRLIYIEYRTNEYPFFIYSKAGRHTDTTIWKPTMNIDTKPAWMWTAY